MQIKVILNPQADRGGGAHYRSMLQAAAPDGHAYDVVLTEKRKDAWRLAREANEQGFDLVVAAGGDGTVHEVVNGLKQAGRGTARLGVVPIGSGNDFAYALDIPTEPAQAIARLTSGEVRRVDLAAVEDDRGRLELFQNNMGVGFDASVVIRTEEITRLRGFPMYMWGVLKTLALDFEDTPLELAFDGQTVNQDLLFLTLGLGPRHGGGFLLTPSAAHHDDLIDTCAAHKMGRWQAMMMINAATKGTHVGSDLVTMRQSREIAIHSASALPIHLDGEIFARPEDGVRSLRVSSLPAALEVVS